ncbi:Retrovirus-related Pol polyprotein from transposon TNT 1-94 [Vitis vinifera]|uniref:Retrovirus-related Pol polyprotein from transposon TNT 1-94 n=1 Tax=Vitis vinifera TaxID=29760 RepID=A0A438D2G6_VITVI|nr:Retrovirus-related Pol polyprotein from transposon TNT 1-94 [Vitis vinifera]
MVETETGLKVKCLRSDNGGEYIDGGFSEYCAAQGIRMEKTIPGTPQQNGVAERMNRTLNERARSMRLHAGLPKTFWADAVSTAAYLINRGPSVPMEFRLPEEVWERKLDAKSKICFFIGYGDEKFGYRSSRNTRPPQRYSPVLNYLLLTDGGEPECYDEALQDENSSKWELAMKDEMDSLLGNQTWQLTELPVGRRLCTTSENLHLEQLDVKTAFLHGDLEEDLYMIQPEGFIVQGQENLVCKLRKSFPLTTLTSYYCCMWIDMLIVGSDIEKINNLKKQLSKQFAMKDLGAAKQILGMRIIRDKANGTLKLSQSEYVKKVLSRFNMNEAKPVSTPLGSHFKLSKEQSPKTEEERDHMSKVPYASAIGSLMYAMVCTRPDIAHAVGVVSRFMSRPGKQHWEAVKWILRYLKGSLDTCLCFTGASLKLQGYVDADFAGDIDSRKSTTGFVFTLGGTAISWTSNLQKIVTLSTTEAEYVAATEAGKEMIWLHGFLDELGKKQEMGILHSDSQSAIFLAKNSAFHSKSKHIQTKYHFIRYLVEDKLVILEKICGSKNPADMLTKGVTIEKLKLCAASIEFSAQFQKNFKSENPDEDNGQPGIHALRAYDSIAVITRALERLASDDTNTPNMTWDNPFSREGGDKNSSRNTPKVLDGPVIWPGYLNVSPRDGKCPLMPKPLKIGIPANTSSTSVKNLEQNYSLPYDFYPVVGTYDELVDCVYNKTYDAVVGDVTILANRSKKVEFTQPYAESGLVMILQVSLGSRVPIQQSGIQRPMEESAWDSSLVHLLFSFLCSYYTASLSSMLTVQRIVPDVMDVEWLKSYQSVVGCDGDSFSGNISAAFLELPYAKVFINQFCKNYTASETLNRFGGLGFAFQKGSPLAADVSEAILTISEEGILKALEDEWFPRSAECSTTETDELSLRSFWALYLLCGATSTLCFLLFFLRLLIDFKRHQASRSNANPNDESVWMKTVQLVHFFHSGQTEIPNERPSNLSPRLTGDEWSTPRWSTVSPSEAPEPPEAPESPEASPPTATMNSRVSPSDEHEPPETPPPTATM